MIDKKYVQSELIYSKHFSKTYENELFIRFNDDNLERMYMHNFTLIKNKSDYNSLFKKEFTKRKKEHKEFIRTETYFSLDEDNLAILPANYGKTVYDFMKIKTDQYKKLQGNSNCNVVKATTSKVLEDGLKTSILSNQDSMGEFAVPRSKRKAEIYDQDDTKIYFYVCYHEGKAVGTCELMIADNLAKIEDFDVFHRYQKKGFGSAIVKELLKVCHDLGIDEAYLITDHDDTAKEMYKKCGFTKFGEKTEILVMFNQ